MPSDDDQWREPCPGSGLVIEDRAPIRVTCGQCGVDVATEQLEPQGRWPRVRVEDHERLIECDESRDCRSRWHGGDCPVGIGERRPIVTIEVQPRPPVPSYATPYWWGNHTLTFRDVDGSPIWEAETVPHAQYGAAKVEKRRGFGWVIVVELSADQADRALQALALDRVIEGKPTSSWAHWPIGSADPPATDDDEDDDELADERCACGHLSDDHVGPFDETTQEYSGGPECSEPLCECLWFEAGA